MYEKSKVFAVPEGDGENMLIFEYDGNFFPADRIVSLCEALSGTGVYCLLLQRVLYKEDGTEQSIDDVSIIF